MNPTHDDLVKSGRLWLLNSRRCRVVTTEMSTAIAETPDVMGWRNVESYMIECKVSRSDFVADQKKYHRQGNGIGQRRWYLTPPSLVTEAELPSGWGLLERRSSKHTRGYFIKEIVPAVARIADAGMLHRERILLVSVAWRALEAQKLVRPLTIGDGP